MAGLKFLNPLVKAVLCVIGMAVMGYYLYESVQLGQALEGINLVRALVFLGFTYLLVQSLKETAGDSRG